MGRPKGRPLLTQVDRRARPSRRVAKKEGPRRSEALLILPGRAARYKVKRTPMRALRGSVNCVPAFRKSGLVAVARGFAITPAGVRLLPVVAMPPSPLQSAPGMPAHAPSDTRLYR